MKIAFERKVMAPAVETIVFWNVDDLPKEFDLWSSDTQARWLLDNDYDAEWDLEIRDDADAGEWEVGEWEVEE